MPQKTARTTNEFSKVAFKINIHKSVAFLFTNSKLSKEKLGEQSHLQLHQKQQNVRE